MAGSVIVAGARTPIGKMSGAFSSLSAADLGGIAIAEALRRAGVSPEQVDHVIMGQVLMAGQGQVPARQAAAKGGVPMRVPAVNINKVCLSGLNSVYLADQMIQAGDADIVVAGGMESMTNAPYIAAGARGGFRYGNVELADAIIKDGLFCAFDACLMGTSTDRYTGTTVSREEMDEVSAASHERAAAAIKDGRLADEIVPVSLPQRKGDPIVVETDEGVRPGTTAESLGKLRPAFVDDGTITAGNASQISDGGSALVIMSERAAAACGVEPLGEVVSYGMVAGPDNPSLNLQPVERDPQGAVEDRPRRRRCGAVRAQRGVRRGRHRVGARSRHLARRRQRERRRHRAGPPDRHERQPPHAHPPARVAPPRRWRRCRRVVRWWRSGRRHHRPYPLTSAVFALVRAENRADALLSLSALDTA